MGFSVEVSADYLILLFHTANFFYFTETLLVAAMPIELVLIVICSAMSRLCYERDVCLSVCL